MKTWGVLFFLWSALSMGVHAQCLVINEIMVNPSGNCDGGCTPSTSEWTELYNTCSNPVDVGCFVLTDGDFAVTIPSGTVLAANGYFVIGSDNSNVPLDLNVATCNCTSGPTNQVGIFTNGNEQLLLVDDSGTLLDGVVWGTGQFSQTPSITTTSTGACPAQTIVLNSNDPIFQTVSSQSNNEDGTIHRSCDGGDWVSNLTSVTPGASNGNGSSSSLTLEATQTELCPGASTTLTANSSEVSWWLNGVALPNTGATLTTTEAGNYQVMQSNPSGCDATSPVLAIVVSAGPVLSLNYSGILETCQDHVVLQATLSSPPSVWVWTFNNELSATNSSQLNANQSGLYTVTALDASGCASNTVSLALTLFPFPTLTLLSSQAPVCQGDSILLVVSPSYPGINWSDGSHADSLWVSQEGNIQVSITDNNGCTNSTNYLAQFLDPPSLVVNTDTTFLCAAPLVLTAASNGSLQWFTEGTLLGTGSTCTVSPENDTAYEVEAVLDGCKTTATVHIHASCLPLIVPNVFTPNGDGFNDWFVIESPALVHLKVVIYNPWGEIVFESHEPGMNWNGWIGSIPASTGVYYYCIEALDYQGVSLLDEEHRSGFVHVMR
jgi:gliding motility-associated-like protein